MKRRLRFVNPDKASLLLCFVARRTVFVGDRHCCVILCDHSFDGVYQSAKKQEAEQIFERHKGINSEQQMKKSNCTEIDDDSKINDLSGCIDVLFVFQNEEN